MAVTKAFLRVIVRGQYVGIPASTFQVEIPYVITTDNDGLDQAGFDEGVFTFAFPLDTAPSAVYQSAWDFTLARITELSWPALPVKSDTFVWPPVDYTVVLPDPPPEKATLQEAAAAVVASNGGLSDNMIEFLHALKRELHAQADAYQAKLESTAGEVIFLPPKPLCFDFFQE